LNGLLLTNLGTPDAPRVPEVRRYLAEFLWDRHVIDINPVGRWLLLHGIILRTRPAKSAHAYAQVWTPAGSPLMVHSKALTAAVQAKLGADWNVALGMRYGSPSLAAGLDAVLSKPIERLVVLPLYPQYATSSTYSTLERVRALVAARGLKIPVVYVRDFFQAPGFIEAQAEVARDRLAEFAPDMVLMSFHGLPERHLTALDPAKGTAFAHCLASPSCCDAVDARNALCYRAQAFATARALAASLGLAKDQYRVAFQSRLGRTPWIRPFTDELVVALAKSGTKRLAVMVPSFTADCLETLEEIGIRARADFKAAGGDELLAVPCVNSNPSWVQAVAELVKATAAGGDTARATAAGGDTARATAAGGDTARATAAGGDTAAIGVTTES